jgi:hypothetical protein
MERIGGSVEQELSRGGGGPALALGAITSAWVEAVGESVSRNAWPLRVGRDGTLHVATSSSSWAFELDRLAPEIAEKLFARLGDDSPKRLRFAVGPVPEPAATQASGAPATAAPEVAPEIAAEAVAAAAEIDDPELRELALRAARASLALPPSDRRF